MGSALFLPSIIDAGAIPRRRVLRFEIPALVEKILEAHDFAGREEPDAVAEVKLRRKIFADGECGAADGRIVGYAGLKPGAGADAFGEQIARCAAERARGAAEHVAFAALESGQGFSGDEVRKRFG